MINGIRIEDETKILDNKAMANGNKPIDFAFIEARDGLKDSPNWSHHKSSFSLSQNVYLVQLVRIGNDAPQ